MKPLITIVIILELALVLALVACAPDRAREMQFSNPAPISAVDDRRNVEKPPATRFYSRTLYHLRGHVTRRIERGMEVRAPRRAMGVNAMDEVPNSTWFTNRIGARALTPDEIRRGAATVGSPEGHLPWTIKSTKQGGKSVGFIIKDARGVKWILKFDSIGKGEMETGADAIATRIMWAAGYNTPEDHVVYFAEDQLVLGKDATVKDDMGGERPLTKRHLAELLARVERGKDGQIRGLASRFLEGKWLGGHVPEGTRPDDPNDRIPHELRRDLRGASAIYAWIDHVDVKEDNFVDMYVQDPADPSRHYVRHYLIDMGLTMGGMSSAAQDPRRGISYAFDVAEIMTSFASLGIAVRPWEGRTDPGIPGVGWFSAEGYDPGAWKPYTPTYVPTLLADRFDNLWGAKLLMRFTPEQLAAAVETARYSNPRTAQYILDTLIARQRMTARYWFDRTAPLDGFALRGSAVCFDDLLLAYKLQDANTVTFYAVEVTNRDGVALPQPVAAHQPIAATASGRTCTVPLAFAAQDEGYTRIRIRILRGGFDRSTYVHVARSNGQRRIIGIWRD